MKDILSTDPQLAEEIQYDLKELEKKEKARQEREDNASEQGSIASDDAASLHDIEDRIQVRLNIFADDIVFFARP